MYRGGTAIFVGGCATLLDRGVRGILFENNIPSAAFTVRLLIIGLFSILQLAIGVYKEHLQSKNNTMSYL